MLPIFKAICISYRNSPLEIRERLSFDENATKEFLRKLNATFGIGEAFVLSTCNRTEIYYSSEGSLKSEILSVLAVMRGFDDSAELKSYFEELSFEDSVKQLYKVSLGLDSKVLGDLQISNQVKKAYQWSADEGMAGPFLHRLLHSIFYASKRVVQETSFRDGTASTAYAAVELAKQFIPNFQAPKVLILGLGEIGENIAENIEGIEAEVFVSNRTLSKAEEIARNFGYQFLPCEHAFEVLKEFDVIISSVAATSPVLTAPLLKEGRVAQQLIVDLSVPRSVAPDAEELHHVLLYNIDHIDQKTSATLAKREAAKSQVENIMNESMDEFFSWTQEMEVSPTIQKLKNALEEIRQRELGKYLKNATETEIKLLDSATKGIIQKVIRLPVLQLKAACKRGDADTLVETLNDLFDLEQQEALNR